MDEEGAFKRDAIRGGRWTTTQQVLVATHNEQVQLRAWYLAFNSTRDNDYTFDPSDYEIVDPVDQEALKKLKAEEVSVIDLFNAEIGYSAAETAEEG